MPGRLFPTLAVGVVIIFSSLSAPGGSQSTGWLSGSGIEYRELTQLEYELSRWDSADWVVYVMRNTVPISSFEAEADVDLTLAAAGEVFSVHFRYARTITNSNVFSSTMAEASDPTAPLSRDEHHIRDYRIFGSNATGETGGWSAAKALGVPVFSGKGSHGDLFVRVVGPTERLKVTIPDASLYSMVPRSCLDGHLGEPTESEVACPGSGAGFDYPIEIDPCEGCAEVEAGFYYQGEVNWCYTMGEEWETEVHEDFAALEAAFGPTLVTPILAAAHCFVWAGSGAPTPHTQDYIHNHPSHPDGNHQYPFNGIHTNHNCFQYMFRVDDAFDHLNLHQSTPMPIPEHLQVLHASSCYNPSSGSSTGGVGDTPTSNGPGETSIATLAAVLREVSSHEFGHNYGGTHADAECPTGPSIVTLMGEANPLPPPCAWDYHYRLPEFSLANRQNVDCTVESEACVE